MVLRGWEETSVVRRMVLVSDEILSARRSSSSWFSLSVSLQRHALPWIWMLGRLSVEEKISRHSVRLSRLGRACVRGAYEIFREASWLCLPL